jgi:quinol-cytochrome oxidoreductase complex cytochrome b subunit
MSDDSQEIPPNAGQATPPNPGQVPPPPPGAYPPPQYGQYPPPGQFPPGQYPPGQYGYQPVYLPPKHPQATLAMVLGIIGLTGVMCYITFFVAPFAWWIGARSAKEIDAEPGRYSGHGEATAGKIMGIIGTVLLILGILALTAFVVAAFTIDDFWEDSGYEDYSILGAF